MAQANKVCPYCKKVGHSGFYCPDKPKKPIKKTAIKPSPRKKKPTASQVKAKLKNGANLTLIDKKVLYDYQEDKAWKAFSTYIRHRDCLATTGTFERGTCVTCVVRGDNTEYPYSLIQAGHAVGGRSAAVLFHEEIVNGQCAHDNRQGNGGLAGDYGNYMTFLVKKYGLEHAESLQRLKSTYRSKYTYEELTEVEAMYKQKTIDLAQAIC